ncbi:MAG: hypothetical protein ABFD50_23650 [Smithella sp.]|nr:hypothetical protein [Chloroflexota bacterium]
MNRLNRRFLIYVLIGLAFGVIDWFYLNWLAHISWGSLGQSILVLPIILLMNYGIWLLPIIPMVTFEVRYANKIIFPMLAGSLTWCCAIFSYYIYYAVLLSTGKLINLEHLNIFGEKYDTFWPEYWQMFKRIILNQFLEWIIIAIVGGAVIGALTFGILYNKAHTSTGISNIQKTKD